MQIGVSQEHFGRRIDGSFRIDGASSGPLGFRYWCPSSRSGRDPWLATGYRLELQAIVHVSAPASDFSFGLRELAAVALGTIRKLRLQRPAQPLERTKDAGKRVH